jgi:hypothetical protein
MQTHIISAASVTTSTDFRITRAFEGDYADYGHQQTAASELILSWYDTVADLVAAGRTGEARQLAEMFPA